MYILVKDNNVFAGPNIWHPKLFKSFIEDDFEIIMDLPVQAPISGTNLGNDIFCYEITQEIPNHNPKIEWLNGPFYTFTGDKAIQTFTVNPKEIEHVKKELLSIIADIRWKKEIAGVEHIIQNQTVILDTSRGNRDIYLQALQTGIDNVSWKFNSSNGNIWLTVSLVELNAIVQSILTHIQTVFDWEKSIADSINNATDLNTLDGIKLGNEVTNPGLGSIL